jgi:hypothetical protein
MMCEAFRGLSLEQEILQKLLFKLNNDVIKAPNPIDDSLPPFFVPILCDRFPQILNNLENGLGLDLSLEFFEFHTFPFKLLSTLRTHSPLPLICLHIN